MGTDGAGASGKWRNSGRVVGLKIWSEICTEPKLQFQYSVPDSLPVGDAY